MEATMVLYFSRWAYHSRCTTLTSYFCLCRHDIVIFWETGNGNDAIYINGKRMEGVNFEIVTGNSLV
jgi:hypothetical protein